MWLRKEIKIASKKRGIHLITDEINAELPELRQIEIGQLNLFVKHTSAAITINENADPDVRIDLNSFIDRVIPENEPYYRHVLEGTDDMPAHIKSVLFGVDLNIPIYQGKLDLGIWQGIYLCEFRNSAGCRTIVSTINGELREE